MTSAWLDINAINEAARLLDGRHSVDDAESLINPGVRNIANVVRPQDNQLDRADLFALLAHGDRYLSESTRPEAERALRRALHIPESDPEGVLLSFKRMPLSHGGQVAVTIITPQKTDPAKQPVVFAGGLQHTSEAMYLHFLTALARESGRKIIAFSAPGVGASQLPKDKGINSDLLFEALTTTMRVTLNPDEHVIVMGHSMGTIAVRHLYFHPSDVTQIVDRFVMATPIPAARERDAGVAVSPAFMLTQGGAVTFTCSMPPLFPAKFFQNHPQTERKWLEARLDEESFPVCLNGMIGSLWQVDNEPMLDELEKTNPQVVWVLAEDDHLIENHNADEWKRRNVVTIKGADHSFMAGGEWTEQFVPQVAAVLDGESNQNSPFVDQSEMLTGFRAGGRLSPFSLKLEGGYSGNEGNNQAVLANLHGNFKAPHADVELGWDGGIGRTGAGRFGLPARFYGHVLVKRMDSHFALGPAAEVGGDLLSDGIQALAGSKLVFDLFGFAQIQAVVGTQLTGDPPKAGDLAGRLSLVL